ncbi:MAG: succinate dehydrogenase/fumarate reductase flavoprotein subunit, partial [Desulfotomaculales bacterium]
MYTSEMVDLIKIVENTRERRLQESFPRLKPEEKDSLLRSFHPDYMPEAMRPVKVGPNKGEKMPHEHVNLLESRSILDPDTFSLENIDYD